MSARFVSVGREMPMLLLPDLRDWVPEDSGEQCNLNDPDARIMRKNKRAGFS